MIMIRSRDVPALDRPQAESRSNVMMDTLDDRHRRDIMVRIKGIDTTPEVAVRLVARTTRIDS